MSKLRAAQLKNLRMGIPVAAMAFSSATAQIEEKAPAQDYENTQHQTTQNDPQPLKKDNRMYIPDAEAFYGLSYDETSGSIRYRNDDKEIDLQVEELDRRSVQEIAKTEKKHLRELNKNVGNKDKVEYVEVDLTEDHLTEGQMLGFCDEKTLKVTMYQYKYDDQFIHNYVKKNILNNKRNYQSISDQIGIENPTSEEIESFIISLLQENASEMYRERVETHENRHLRIAQQYGGRSGISPEQHAILKQTNEISANIAEVLMQREKYIKTGNIDMISDDFKFYKDAIRNREIVPGSRVKEFEEKEFSLIMNGTQNYWMSEKQEMYLSQYTIEPAKEYIDLHRHEIRTLAPNDKELDKREKDYLTFQINGKEVNLKEFRDAKPQIPEQYRQEIDNYYQEQCGGISPGQLDKIKKIKSQDELDKLKIENCSKYDQQLRKNAALKILEKQGRRLAPKNLHRNEHNQEKVWDYASQKQRNNTK